MIRNDNEVNYWCAIFYLPVVQRGTINSLPPNLYSSITLSRLNCDFVGMEWNGWSKKEFAEKWADSFWNSAIGLLPGSNIIPALVVVVVVSSGSGMDGSVRGPSSSSSRMERSTPLSEIQGGCTTDRHNKKIWRTYVVSHSEIDRRI